MGTATIIHTASPLKLHTAQHNENNFNIYIYIYMKTGAASLKMPLTPGVFV